MHTSPLPSPENLSRWEDGHLWAAGWSLACSRLLLVSPAQHEALSEYRPILSEAHRLQHHSSMADKKLVLIPVIFICLRVWSTVRFVLTLCGSPAVQTPVLVVLHVRTEVCPPWPCCPGGGSDGFPQKSRHVPTHQPTWGLRGLGTTVPSFLPEMGSLCERRWEVRVPLVQPGAC